MELQMPHWPCGAAGPGRWQEEEQSVTAASTRAMLPSGGELWWTGSRAQAPLQTSQGVIVPQGHSRTGFSAPLSPLKPTCHQKAGEDGGLRFLVIQLLEGEGTQEGLGLGRRDVASVTVCRSLASRGHPAERPGAVGFPSICGDTAGPTEWVPGGWEPSF